MCERVSGGGGRQRCLMRRELRELCDHTRLLYEQVVLVLDEGETLAKLVDQVLKRGGSCLLSGEEVSLCSRSRLCRSIRTRRRKNTIDTTSTAATNGYGDDTG